MTGFQSHRNLIYHKTSKAISFYYISKQSERNTEKIDYSRKIVTSLNFLFYAFAQSIDFSYIHMLLQFQI